MKCVICGNEIQKGYNRKYTCSPRCSKIRHKQPIPKERKRDHDRTYREKHHDELSKKDKEYYQKNKHLLKWRWKNVKSDPILYQKKKDANNRYIKKKKEKIKKYKQQYREEHREELNEKQKAYMKDPINKKHANSYIKKRIKINPLFAVAFRLRQRVRIAIRSYTKTGKIMTAREYGINYKEIIEYLKPFPKDLENWHIDHRRPLVSFNFVNLDGSTNLEEIKKAFAPRNHQWLTAHENLSKSGKWDCVKK